METNSIGALIGGTSDSSKKKESVSSADGANFAAAMGDAEQAVDGEKKAQLISKEESDKDKAAKADQKEKQTEQADRAERAKRGAQDKKAAHAQQKGGRVSEFLKNITTKDPATLSMAERASFQVGEFAAQNKATGMAKMLASQGIDMTSFSPQQIMSLLSRMDTQELGKLMSGLKAAGVNIDEETLNKFKEQLNAQNQNQAAKEPGNFNLQSFMSAGMPKEAGESARQEQRQAVLDQILTNIQVRNVANQTEMQLRLNPEYLGEVKIKLIHDAEGGVKATFETTSKLTSEVLAESKDELIKQAGENGVDIGSMDVEFVDELSA